jgi:DNA helicase-2/ATP-dependent DNA helicase PcrA
LKFEKDFLGAKIIRLEENYRSTKNILSIADSVISNNRERHGKTLWTQANQGEKVKFITFLDDRTEAAKTAELIESYCRKNFFSSQVAKKYNFSEIAILVRASYQTRVFEEAFIRQSLPYKVIGGMKFYERSEIKDAISYLRIIFNSADDLALTRIINTPKRGIGEATLNNLRQKSKEKGVSLFSAIKKSIEESEIKGKAKDSLKSLFCAIESSRLEAGKKTLPELAKSILNDAGYISALKNENTVESDGRLENITEFINSLADFSNLVEFLEYVSLVEARDSKALEDSINIMTIHSAKGLEFNLVFIVGLEDGVFPSSKSMDDKKSLEEERRLFYVAITRAKKELILSSCKNRFVFSEYQTTIPSRFIAELPRSEVIFEEVDFRNNSYNFEIPNERSLNANIFQESRITSIKNPKENQQHSLSGKRIFHQKFGYGKIVSIDGSKLEINFEKSGKKTIMREFVEVVQ